MKLNIWKNNSSTFEVLKFMKLLTYLQVLTLVLGTAFQQQDVTLPNISGPEQVFRELENALSTTPSNSLKAFALYSETAQRFARRGNYEEADSLFTMADALTQLETDSSKVFEMNLSRANMNKEQGKYTMALQTYMEALDFYQKSNDVNAQAWVYSYLIEFYRATLNEELCLKFIEEGEEFIAANTVGIKPRAYVLQAKSSYFLQFQESVQNLTFEERRANLEQALSIAQASQDSYLIGLNQNGLGFLLMHNNPSESDEIEAYFESAKAHMLANERFRNYTSVLQNFAMYYTRSGSPEKAVDMTFEAIELSKKNHWNSHLGDLYRLAGEVHYELGLFKESAEYLNEALGATKASMDKMHSIELGELTTTFEKVVTERKLAEQQIETGIAKQQAIDNKKALITTVIISMVFLVIAIISVILYLRLKGANGNLLSQQEITKRTNAKLSDVVEQKNTLYKELNHRVKNNLSVLSGLIYLQEDAELIESQRSLYQSLRHRIQSMALVHENLYEFDQTTNINFQRYLGHLIDSISSSFSYDNNVNINISCDNLVIDIDEAVPMAMIINELITNSFKYAFRAGTAGKIMLWSEVKDNKRTLHYKDNGPGMPKEKDPQSLGMLLVELMTKQLKGQLFYHGDNDGVYFKLEIGNKALAKASQD